MESQSLGLLPLAKEEGFGAMGPAWAAEPQSIVFSLPFSERHKLPSKHVGVWSGGTWGVLQMGSRRSPGRDVRPLCWEKLQNWCPGRACWQNR